MGGDQEWKHRKINQTPIYNLAAGTCLYVEQPKAGAIVQLGLCSNDAYSSWDLVKKPLWSSHNHKLVLPMESANRMNVCNNCKQNHMILVLSSKFVNICLK